MNEYKITYSGESEGYRLITDRTEAAAKRTFREDVKEMDMGRITIESVELVRTDALASKRNERETLETIRQLVADLGENSYLATAFEGCFEDAEANIENDFGDSWKRRAESAGEKLAEAEKKIKTMELDNRDLRAVIGKTKEALARAEQAKEDLERELGISQKEIEALRDQLAESQKDYEDYRTAAHAAFIQKDGEIEALQAKVLSPDDMEDVRQLLADRVNEAEEKAKQAAADIVKYAEAPTSKEFQEALRIHRSYIRDVEYTKSLLGRVVAAQAAARTAGAC